MAIDDCSRVTYLEVHPEESTLAATGFIGRALGFLAAHDGIVQRVMTDNGPATRGLFAHALATVGSATPASARTGPRPWPGDLGRWDLVELQRGVEGVQSCCLHRGLPSCFLAFLRTVAQASGRPAPPTAVHAISRCLILRSSPLLVATTSSAQRSLQDACHSHPVGSSRLAPEEPAQAAKSLKIGSKAGFTQRPA
jgi:hypothetical protein